MVRLKFSGFKIEEKVKSYKRMNKKVKTVVKEAIKHYEMELAKKS